MRLGIDLDGVVADVDTGWMELHRDEFGSRLTPDTVTSWNDLHELGGFDDMAGVAGLGLIVAIVGTIAVDVASGTVRRRIIAGPPRLLDDTDGINGNDHINRTNGNVALPAVDTGGAS